MLKTSFVGLQGASTIIFEAPRTIFYAWARPDAFWAFYVELLDGKGVAVLCFGYKQARESGIFVCTPEF